MHIPEGMALYCNQQIASQLEALARSLAGKGGKDKWRAKTYFSAADAIRRYPVAIQSGKQAQDEIKGVGKTTAERIDEFLRKGSVMLESRQEDTTPDFDKASVIALFTKLHGVGDVTAEKWYNEGYRTLEDLAVLYPGMTSAQQLGYRYHLQLKLRIPRSEIDSFQTIFQEVITNHEFLICGSYRRGHRTSGDIDLLIKGKGGITDGNILAEVIDQLNERGIILGKLSMKNKKFLGIASLSSRHNARRLDVMVTPPENWAAAILYFTGSKELNIQMREAAGMLGMRLNEYGLWKLGPDGSTKMEDMELLETETEEEIFELLGLDYTEPEDRDI